MNLVRAVLEELELSFSEEKTSLTSDEQGFDFLGFPIRRGYVTVRPKSIERFKDEYLALIRRGERVGAA